MAPQVTARVSEDLHKEIEAVSDEIDGTKAEAIRTLLERGVEINEIKAENERLRNQLAAANTRIDDVNHLVEYVESERTLAERREDRRDAPIWTRAKWAIFGRSTDG